MTDEASSDKPAAEGGIGQLGEYRILKRLGSGGMGEVYLAEQTSLKRRVALKLLRPELSEDPGYCRRFAKEAEAAARLTHGNIVQIYAFGQEQGVTYMAMEYIEGMNLGDYVRKKGPLSLGRAVKVLEQVGVALKIAGDARVVHRDIKPDNILLSKAGEVKVADFGLARLRDEPAHSLTQSGMAMGTPLYMSPEQVEDKELDQRSDLYSLGVTCFYMLTGQPPFQADTAMAVAAKHLHAAVPSLQQKRPDLPDSLCAIVNRLMAKDPATRYQSARSLLSDLKRLKSGIAAAQTLGLEKPKSARRSYPLTRFQQWGLVATGLLAVGVGGSIGLLGNRGSQISVAQPEKTVSYGRGVAWQQVPRQESAEKQFRYAELIGSMGDEEAAWLAVIKRYPQDEPWCGKAQLQLLCHYLKSGDLHQSSALTAELASNRSASSRRTAAVGRAAILALQDRPRESLNLIWKLVSKPQELQPDQRGEDLVLVDLVLWTLERNMRNLGQDWTENVRLKRWVDGQLTRFRSMRRLANP